MEKEYIRVEDKTPEQLQELINYAKGMETYCLQTDNYQMETFYHKARKGFEERLQRLVKKNK